MNELQIFAALVMTLIIGIAIGRSSKKAADRNSQTLTPQEWASLQPKGERNPYSDVHPDVLFALKSNNKIEAIKLFRQYHSGSLKEAKHAIDAIFKNHQ